MMLWSALKGFAIEASDGRIGTVKDFLFDDRTWKIRWLVVDDGGWLTGRRILVHPSAIGQPDCSREKLPVRLTKQQIEDSPDILSDAPVSRQLQSRLYGYYNWDPFWGGGNYLGEYSSGMGGAFDPPPHLFNAGLLEAERAETDRQDGDPHLRSIAAIVGYHIQATDGPIGHVEDSLVDQATWTIHYLVIDTKNWWPGQHVVMSPHAVRRISWSDCDVALNVTREKVKRSPPWDPTATIDEGYKGQLHGHYGWPGHG